MPHAWRIPGWGAALLLSALASGAAAQPSPQSSPRRTVALFDSLMENGSPAAVSEARALTIGQARRLFPLLAEAQAKFAPLVDTARSRDTVLEERRAESWSALRVYAVAVFKRPVLGMDSLATLQAVHLHRGADGTWRIAEFEELGGYDEPLVPRSGSPEATGAPASAFDASAPLPLSRLAPSGIDMPRVTRMRLRVSSRGGSPLPLPEGPGQRVVSRDAGGAVIETRVATVRDSQYLAPWDDSLGAYRASTDELDLTDKMLRTLAAKLKQGSRNEIETADRIRRHVSGHFEYRLGATLFAGSREALRSMKGDCSEAAVLVAALLRAAGVPSRVVLGYATLGDGVWIGHAWAEGFLGGDWVGVDAALREFPAGAARLALLTLSGEKPMKAEATNLMLRTIADLDVQITGAWAGEAELPLVEHPGAAESARAFWGQVLEGMGR